MRDRNITELIGRTYDAAQDESLWLGLAPWIAETFDSNSTVLHLRETSAAGALVLSAIENFGPDLQESYDKYYWQHDIWHSRVVRLGLTSKVVTSRDLIADSDFERSEVYNDFLRATGIFYIICAVFSFSAQTIGSFGIHHPRQLGHYEEPYRAGVSEYLQHLQRALQIRQKLQQMGIERQVGLTALEHSRIAAVVVNGNGWILYATRAAEVMLRKGDAIRTVGGRLCSLGMSHTECLLKLIRDAAATAAGGQGSAGGTVSIPRLGRLPVTVLVAPFRPAQCGAGAAVPAAILFIRDPEHSQSPSEIALREFFGLTPGEATITVELVGGLSLAQIAARHRLSTNTVRTHLMNFDKQVR